MVDTIAPPDGAERTGDAPEETAVSMRRAPTLWDVSGLLLLTSVVLGLMCVTPLVVQGWFHRPGAMVVATVVVGSLAAVTVAAAVVRGGSTLRSTPSRLTAVWRDPPGDWPAFALGGVLSLPLLGLYTPTLPPDSDSVRIVAAVRHVQRGNLDYLVETQDSFGPQLILGPLLALFGTEGLRLFTIISVQLLAGVVAWLTRRISASMLAAAVAAVGLLAIPPVMDRTIYLPMYPVMLALGSLGCWLAYRTVVEGARWYYAVGSGFLLVLAQEAHAVGQLLLAVPLLLLLATPAVRKGLVRVVGVYAWTLVFLAPRLVVNYSEGGLSQLRSNRTDYWIAKGYLRQIQSDFWGYDGLDESYATYLLLYPGRFVSSLGAAGWVLVALAVIALVGLRGRVRLFVLAYCGLIAAAMTVLTIQTTSRYFSPLWPGLVAFAGVAVAKLVHSRQLVLRLASTAVVVAIAATFFHTYRSTALRARETSIAADQRGYTTAVAFIDDDKGIIGVRSTVLLSVDPDLKTYGTQLLSEEDYVTYLTWPSDAEVIEMMERNDIGWVATTKNEAYEIDYNNTWLVPDYGIKARHPDMLRASPEFCEVPFEANGIRLWKMGDDCFGHALRVAAS